jgi:hypothetical protein
MLAGAVFDVLGGDRSAWSEVVHLEEFVGMALVWLIAGSPGRDRVERFVSHHRRGGGVAPTTT